MKQRLPVLILALNVFFCSACDPSDDDDSALDDDDTVDDDDTTGGARGMIALHLDPNGPVALRATPEHWERLDALVDKADEHGHKLTLQMSSDWADLVGSDPERRAALGAWIASGHQLGFHHHTCDHASPDGYRDIQPGDCNGATDRGSVALAFATVRELGSGLTPPTPIEVAAQGPNTDGLFRAAEWQPEAIHATGEIGENTDGHVGHRFITLPRCTNSYGNSYSGSPVQYDVAELGHAQLNVGAFTGFASLNNLATLETEIDRVLSGDHADTGAQIGVVFHGREYHANPRDVDGDEYSDDQAYLDAVFQLFTDKGLPVATTGEILSAVDPCSD